MGLEKSRNSGMESRPCSSPRQTVGVSGVGLSARITGACLLLVLVAFGFLQVPWLACLLAGLLDPGAIRNCQHAACLVQGLPIFESTQEQFAPPWILKGTELGFGRARQRVLGKLLVRRDLFQESHGGGNHPAALVDGSLVGSGQEQRGSSTSPLVLSCNEVVEDPGGLPTPPHMVAVVLDAGATAAKPPCRLMPIVQLRTLFQHLVDGFGVLFEGLDEEPRGRCWLATGPQSCSMVRS